MMVIPLILLIVGVSDLSADSHSLRFHETAVTSSGPRLPLYFIIAYVDEQMVANYSSVIQRPLPKTEWMKNVPDFWEEATSRSRKEEPFMKNNLQIAMERSNNTRGFHIVQRMVACMLRDDGSTVWYYQYGYNGRDLMYVDTQRWIYVPVMNEAQISTQRWNSPEVRMAKRHKSFLENECLGWLKQFIQSGREDLERRVRPGVKVWGHQSDGVTRLQCLAYGFRPRDVDVKWVRNGEDHIPSDEASPILPHPDGTYQIRVSVEVPTTEGNTYSCHVDHSSLEKTLTVQWDPSVNGRSMDVIICTIVGLTALALIITAVYIYTKRIRESNSTNSSNTF